MSSQGHTAPQDQGSWKAGLLLPVSGSSLLTPQGNILTISDTALDVWDPKLGIGAEAHNTITVENPEFQTTLPSSAILIPD